MGQLEPVALEGTENAGEPFFSPDGQEIGFFHAPTSRLWRVSVAGGAPVPIGPVPMQTGVTWAEDGWIYFGQGPQGIWRVRGDGGTPEIVVELADGQAASSPQLLPGGEWLLFTLTTRGDASDGGVQASIVAHALGDKERLVLIEDGTDARWIPTGHLVYAVSETLFAVPFDLQRMQPGRAVSVLDGVRPVGGNQLPGAQYAIGGNGTLVYVRGGGGLVTSQLAWVSRDGRTVEPESFEPRRFMDPALSPDGQRIAVGVEADDGKYDIWIYQVGRGGTGVRLTEEGNNEFPVWSHDSEWVYFQSDRGGGEDIWKRRIDRRGDAELVLDLDDDVRPAAISADGTRLLVARGNGVNGQGGILNLTGDSEPVWLRTTSAGEYMDDFSPDGRFVAYDSRETGDRQTYVMEVASGAIFQVSSRSGGCTLSRWSKDGRKIFCRSVLLGAGSSPTVELFAVTLTMDPFSASEPAQVASVSMPSTSSFDVDDEGRILIATPVDTTGTADSSTVESVRVILNWFDELRRLVPVR